ncbi:hypothetical protein DFS33DRAFT_1276038 [Desarmillaria ectypa]|nr:hypothetical protein DFS33DRAFT_1276038 [Desarmillaria ectypa]
MRHCDDCFAGTVCSTVLKNRTDARYSGVTHDGTPTGDYPKNKVILLLTDVFGIPLINNKTIVPDLFLGDAIPEGAMDPVVRHLFDRDRWFAAHGPAQTRPPLDQVVAALKESGVTKFGASGYCFGGTVFLLASSLSLTFVTTARYVFDLAFDGIISVSVISHPSRLTFPEDFEKYANDVKAPLLINSLDQIFYKFEPGYKREYFEGCRHGFAVRGDLSDPKVKAGKEGSFRAAAKWFLEYL